MSVEGRPRSGKRRYAAFPVQASEVSISATTSRLTNADLVQPIQRGLWPHAYFLIGSQPIAVTTVRIKQECVWHLSRVKCGVIELATRNVVLIVLGADDQRRGYLRFQVQIRRDLTVFVQISRIHQDDEIGSAAFPVDAVNCAVSALGKPRAGFRAQISSGRESDDS